MGIENHSYKTQAKDYLEKYKAIKRIIISSSPDHNDFAVGSICQPVTSFVIQPVNKNGAHTGLSEEMYQHC